MGVGRLKRAADVAADGTGYLFAVLIVGGAAVYPLILAAETGRWWIIAVAATVIGVGAVALIRAAIR